MTRAPRDITATLESVLETFAIPTKDATCVPLASTRNHLFRIDCASGQFALRITPRNSWPAIQDEIHVSDQLASLDVCVRTWLRTSNGERCVPTVEGIAMAAKFIPGKPLDPTEPGSCHRAGSLLARIHSAPLHLDSENSASILSLSSIKAAGLRRSDQTAAKTLQELIGSQPEINHDWATLPKGVLHGDYHCGNVISTHRPKKGLTAIDFEHCANGPYVFDIARAIADICRIQSRLDRARLAEFLDGYGTIRALVPGELQSLLPWIRVSCAVLAVWCMDHGLPALADDFLSAGTSSRAGGLL